MRGDRRIFVVGLLLSGTLHAALLLGVRSRPGGDPEAPAPVQPLALIAVPASAAAPPLEAVLPVPPAPRVPPRELPPEPVPALAPAAAPVVAPTPLAPPLPAAAPAAPAAAAPAPPPPAAEPAARRLAQGRYEQTVTQWVERQRAYPLAARRRGWEGTAIVRLRLAADGSLLMAQLVRDTGFAPLDEAALGMVRRAAPYPRLPEEIGDSQLELLVPIHFSLGS